MLVRNIKESFKVTCIYMTQIIWPCNTSLESEEDRTVEKKNLESIIK